MEGKKIFIVLALVAMAASLDVLKLPEIYNAMQGEGMPPFISLTRKMVHLGPW